jgi:hypothetical protein
MSQKGRAVWRLPYEVQEERDFSHLLFIDS